MSPPGVGTRSRWLIFAAVLWGTALVVVLIRAGLFPDRNSVFGVFRRGGARWLEGEPLYPDVGEFLYSPLAAILFSPLATLPAGISGVLWRLGSATGYLTVVNVLLRRPWSAGGQPRSEVRAMGWIVLLPLSLGNLNNGQAGPLVVALLLGATLAVEARRWTLAAVGIAVATFFKVYPLAVGLLLVALYPRQLGWRLTVALALGFVLSLLLSGPTYGWEQYRAWFANLGADSRRLLGPFGMWRDSWLLLRLARVPISVGQYAGVQAGAGLAAAVFCGWGQRSGRWNPGRTAFAAFGLGCAWVTLFGPATESATYLFLGPPMAFGATAVLAGGQSTPVSPTTRALWWLALILLITSEMLSAFLPAVGRSDWGRAVQPVGGLCFLGFLVGWLRCDRAWASAEFTNLSRL